MEQQRELFLPETLQDFAISLTDCASFRILAQFVAFSKFFMHHSVSLPPWGTVHSKSAVSGGSQKRSRNQLKERAARRQILESETTQTSIAPQYYDPRSKWHTSWWDLSSNVLSRHQWPESSQKAQYSIGTVKVEPIRVLEDYRNASGENTFLNPEGVKSIKSKRQTYPRGSGSPRPNSRSEPLVSLKEPRRNW